MATIYSEGQENVWKSTYEEEKARFYRLKEGMAIDYIEHYRIYEEIPSSHFDTISEEEFEREFLEGSSKVVCLGVPSEQFEALVSRQEKKFPLTKA